MFQATKGTTTATRVNSIIDSDVESRGAGWLLGLGAGACNDYAQSVVDRASYTPTGFDPVRFETVSRYIRAHKAKLKAAQPK